MQLVLPIVHKSCGALSGRKRYTLCYVNIGNGMSICIKGLKAPVDRDIKRFINQKNLPRLRQAVGYMYFLR